MTDIAFHFNAPDKLAYVCRLLRKAVSSGAKVVVSADAPTLQALDTQLWTFEPLSFLPHGRLDSPPEVLQASPIVLALELPEGVVLPHHQVLVNLCAEVQPAFAQFERAIEVVSLDAQDREQARARWKHYAAQGYSITRHDLNLRDTAA